MKQIIFFISTLFVVLGLHAQTAVNEDGSIKFRGNVAIVVDSKCYTFSDGVAVKTVDDGTSAALNPNRSLENDKKLFLMTAIRKTALYMLDS